jgi:hypothetical protein
MRFRKAVIRIGIRLLICTAIIFIMLICTQYIIETYSGPHGHPSEGKAILLSLVVVLAGIVGMIFTALYKSNWVERNR